ncbi:hemagglutinin repeat-containing protein, partial [Enterobacteriaceae bacterium YMB-R22]|uniref:hemagglutinin repeat-containing protein n=1 Tax=Tenebrionicola larvae TaxID=2815733 RepID=UPI00201162CB
ALLYAGNNLKLLANSIQNLRGDILAGNSLWMQKDEAGTANNKIINRSGTIETVNGDITLNTAHLLNSWDSLTATHEVIPGDDTGTLSPLPPNNWWEIRTDDNGPYLLVYWTSNPAPEYKVQMGDKEVVTVAATGSAGRIASGRDMTINAANLENEASYVLAGGNMRLSGDTLSNQGWQEGTSVTESVWALDSSRRYVCGAYECKGYRLSSQTTTDLDGKLYRAVISAGGSVDARFTRDISNTTTTANAGGMTGTLTAPTLNTLSNQTIDGSVQAESLTGADSVTIGSPQWQDQLNGALQQISGSSALGNTPDGSTPGKVDTSAYPLPSGNNGYFVTSTDPDSPYLITVNPKLDGLGQLDESLFGDLYALLGIQPGQAPRETGSQYTDQNQFLGSAYFLDRLNLNPDYDYRFLGDAAFDTRYASNFILNQTGSRYINGVGSDLEQMRKLVDNAAVASQALGLEFGVALTATQIAALDSSIIWWEAATMNGQTVMVPKVYLSPKDVTVLDGSVINGSDVMLAAGNITNSGSTLTAQNNLTANSQNSLSNLNAGLISAGNGLQLSALGDINNVSATISGKTVALESVGGSINNTTLTERLGLYATSNRGDTVNLTSTLTGNTASISATDGLLMKAGQDINVTGANVSAGGSLAMVADGNISVTENQLSDGYTGTDFRGESYGNDISNQGSHITAGNNLAMQAGNNLTLSASSVNAGGTAQLIAGNDLNLNSAATATNSSYGNSGSHATGVDRTTVTAGDDLALVAGRDLNSQAAGLAAEGSVGLQAGRDVNLLAEATTEGDSYRASKKVEINESVRQQGTEIASSGNTT